MKNLSFKSYYGNAYNSSYECLMRDTTYQFCEVCKLQGSKRMSQLIDGKSLYVADPEVKKYTGQYSAYSDFVDTTYTGYYNFANYRDGVLLSGADKNKFNADMVGKKNRAQDDCPKSFGRYRTLRYYESMDKTRRRKRRDYDRRTKD